MLWLYFLGLVPVVLLLLMWCYDARRARPSHRRPQQRERTILLVDDDQKVCQLMGRQLGRQGFHVLTAADAESALALAKSYPDQIDLVIADVIMPGMTGPQLADCMRGNRPLTPVIFISGLAEEPGLSYGCTSRMAFLAKPFNFDRLKHKVEDVLEAAQSS